MRGFEARARLGECVGQRKSSVVTLRESMGPTVTATAEVDRRLTHFSAHSASGDGSLVGTGQWEAWVSVWVAWGGGTATDPQREPRDAFWNEASVSQGYPQGA